jgi:hypothetical protein
MRFKKSNCRKKMVFSQPDVRAALRLLLLQARTKTNLLNFFGR